MKKKVLAAMLVAAMTATMFAGCGSKDNGASNDGTQAANNGSTSESAEPVDVKLTVMGPSEDQDDAQGAWLKTECEAFNEEHPQSLMQKTPYYRILQVQRMYSCLQMTRLLSWLMPEH